MLTDTECRRAVCPEGKARERFSDSGGLYLEVSPTGSKRWFWKYRARIGDKTVEKRLALGSYGTAADQLTLKAARAARDEARALHAKGTDPVHQRATQKATRAMSAAVTFEAVARELHAQKSRVWSATHAAQWLRCCEKDLFPYIGARPLATITAPELLAVLRRVTARGATYLARDLREFAGQVFRYGVSTGRAERDPAADLRDALAPHVTRHMGAVLEPAQAGALMRDIDAYQGQPVTRAALQLSALLFQRPGNIRSMAWADVDLDGGLWTIAAAQMKRDLYGKTNGRPHLVPLAPQAVAVLREIHPLTGHGRYVFPSLLTGERCMSENTLRAALRRMGYTNEEMTAHGFRAMARTLMVERLPNIAPEVIEAQLAHGKAGPLGMAYDRAEFMTQRRQMMEAWADYLDLLRKTTNVVPLTRKAA